MRPNINVLEPVDGVLQAITRPMRPEEYEEYLREEEKLEAE